MKTLSEKLQLKIGHRAAILNAPPGYMNVLGPLPDRVTITREPGSGLDFVHLFVTNREELDRLLGDALASVKRDGVFWISFPKKSSKKKTDLGRDVGWEALVADGWEIVSAVAIDETWSALRFRPSELVRR